MTTNVAECLHQLASNPFENRELVVLASHFELDSRQANALGKAYDGIRRQIENRDWMSLRAGQRKEDGAWGILIQLRDSEGEGPWISVGRLRDVLRSAGVHRWLLSAPPVPSSPLNPGSLLGI